MARAHVQSEAAEVIGRECLATRMRRLNRVVSGIYDRAFREIGVTGSQMSILVFLMRSGGAKPVEVCGALQMDKSTLCRNIQRMQRQGWVRTAAVDDARSHRLEVTEVGRGLIERALPLWRGAQAEARAVLGDAVAEQLFEAGEASFSGDGSGGRGVAGVEVGAGEGKFSVSGGESGVMRPSEPMARAVRRPAARGIFFWE
jgi:DNA-binding MarR family transcriptional regulator